MGRLRWTPRRAARTGLGTAAAVAMLRVALALAPFAG